MEAEPRESESIRTTLTEQVRGYQGGIIKSIMLWTYNTAQKENRILHNFKENKIMLWRDEQYQKGKGTMWNVELVKGREMKRRWGEYFNDLWWKNNFFFQVKRKNREDWKKGKEVGVWGWGCLALIGIVFFRLTELNSVMCPKIILGKARW